MCISIVQKANENSIEFFLSTQTRRVIKSSQTKSLQVPATCKGFLEMFTQIQSLSGLAVIHKLACSQ